MLTEKAPFASDCADAEPSDTVACTAERVSKSITVPRYAAVCVDPASGPLDVELLLLLHAANSSAPTIIRLDMVPSEISSLRENEADLPARRTLRILCLVPRFWVSTTLAIGAASSLFVAACNAPAPLEPRAATPGSVHFRVMSFNIHRYRSNDEPTIATIGAPNVEIACVQEVTAAWEKVLRDRYASQYEHMLFAPDEEAGGLGFLSHYPLEDRGVVRVPGNWHPAWVVRVTTPGGPVQVLNLHLRSLFEGESNPLSSYAASSADHVSEMNLFLEHVDPGLPTFIVGDFNEGPTGDAVRELERDGYSNALPMFHPGQYTWQGASVGSTMELAIDHVMFDDAFTPLDAVVLRQGNSDHLPVVGSFELRSPMHGDGGT